MGQYEIERARHEREAVERDKRVAEEAAIEANAERVEAAARLVAERRTRYIQRRDVESMKARLAVVETAWDDASERLEIALAKFEKGLHEGESLSDLLSAYREICVSTQIAANVAEIHNEVTTNRGTNYGRSVPVPTEPISFADALQRHATRTAQAAGASARADLRDRRDAAGVEAADKVQE